MRFYLDSKTLVKILKIFDSLVSHINEKDARYTLLHYDYEFYDIYYLNSK
jgi:hypothetical protein